MPSSGELLFQTIWERWAAFNLELVEQHRFAPPRRWRFDFAHLETKVAVEIDGGNFVHGRHTRGLGFEADCEKLNQAQILGWKVLRYTPRMLTNDPVAAIGEIEALILSCARMKGITYADRFYHLHPGEGQASGDVQLE